MSKEREVLQQTQVALGELLLEFRIADLPYGSRAYAKGVDASHAIKEVLAQPEQQWVDLTDQEISVAVDAFTFDSQGYDIWTDGEALVRDVQAKLKERNLDSYL